jgi:hypothetical protein
MKKFTFLLSFLACGFAFAQSMTYDQAAKSMDPAAIQQFIRQNPGHPKNDALKVRADALSRSGTGQTSVPQASATASSSAPTGQGSGSKQVYRTSGDAAANNKAAEALNAMFNTNPNKKTVTVFFNNQSKCTMDIVFSGKASKTLRVPANGQNFITLDKGTYRMSSNSCNASYNSTKSFTEDATINLKM